jgi:nicotinate-nucleotide adenylyltransferase
MAKIAFQHIPHVEISRIELESAGPTYTADSLPEITKRYGLPFFTIGVDQLAQIQTWHRFPEVLGMAHWVVLLRKNQPPKLLENALAQLTGSSVIHRFSPREARTNQGTYMLFQETKAPGISSTQVREALARSGDGANEWLDPKVLTYLKMHRIYGN